MRSPVVSGASLASATATGRVAAVVRQMSSINDAAPPGTPEGSTHSAATTKVEVRHQKMQSVRLFLLNRVKALNALNMSMVQNITPQLQVWAESNLCKVVVLTNTEDSRAFCAGGDVKGLVLQASSGKPEDIAKSLKFFEEEYKLNHLIGTLQKPFISIMNGITMGGGVGLSVHAPFRVATEKTRFAMPETAIGLFPDVGGSFFLPRMDGELGTYLGLTGANLKGEEVFMAGIATHYIPSERLPALMSRLAELETDEREVVNSVLEEFVGDSDLEKWKNWSLGGEVGTLIDRCFKYNTIEEIIEALEKESSSFAKKTIGVIKSQSPTSLKVTLEQLRRGRKQSFADCFQMEYNMVREFLSTPDFYEGVKAKLIDKPPREPQWKPSWDEMSELTPTAIGTYFEPAPNAGNVPKNSNSPARQLAFLNPLTYWDYPHRPMSGLPTIQDIKRVVEGMRSLFEVYFTQDARGPDPLLTGKGRRGTTTAAQESKEDVVLWFEQNWGGYDSSVIGTKDAYLPNTYVTIEGGFGRGKVGLREKVLTVLDRYTEEQTTAGGRSLNRRNGHRPGGTMHESSVVGVSARSKPKPQAPTAQKEHPTEPFELQQKFLPQHFADMPLRLRRAEVRDSSAIHRLINAAPLDEVGKILRKRFGEPVDLPDIIDGSPFSIVATETDDDDELVGFLALDNGPPPYVDNDEALAGAGNAVLAIGQSSDWTKWVQRNFDCPADIQVHNTKFLRFIVAHPTHAAVFLQEALACALDQLIHTRTIAYFLPRDTPLFAPLNANRMDMRAGTPPTQGAGAKKAQKLFTDVPLATPDGNFRMLICARKPVSPVLRVRAARVEDADDLEPMFREQKTLFRKLIGNQNHRDIDLAALLDEQTDTVKTLVAEVAGQVVGFMTIDREIQQTSLLETFHLEPFDNLMKEPPKKAKATVVVRNPTPPPATPSPDPQDENERIDELEEPFRLSTVIKPTPGSSRPSTGHSGNAEAAAEIDTFQADALTGPSSPTVAFEEPLSPIAAPRETTAERNQRIVEKRPNAFCVSLFAIAAPYASQAHQLVKAAFTAFPDRDYCVVTTATVADEIPLVRTFVPVPARRGMFDGNVLYVANRFSILDTPAVTIARAKEEDLDDVDTFVDELQGQDDLRAAFGAATENQTGTVPRSFVVRTAVPPSGAPAFSASGEPLGGQLVGVVVTTALNSPEEKKQWTDQFEIAEYTPANVAFVRAILLNPLFACCARWVLEEVMRQTGLHALLHAAPYDIDIGSGNTPVVHRTDAATQAVAQREFIPVRPRREIAFPNNLRDGVPVPPPLPCSLRILAAPLLYERKVVVNTRIVVVGASDCGLGFLDKLAYNPRITFTNLTLISTNGLPFTESDGTVPYVSHRGFGTTELVQLGLADHVRIVRGTVEEVDRLARRCVLEDGSAVNYDYVVLTPGLQFNTTSLGTGAASLHGIYALNPGDDEDALDIACAKAGEGRFVVYGRDLQAFAGVQMLLGKGVAGHKISLVIPPLRMPMSCFNNAVVDSKVRDVMVALGVAIHDGYALERIESEFGAVTGVVLRSPSHKPTKLAIRPVQAILYADDRSVAPGTFRVINDSCLVFDGRLVIDKWFSTPDSAVFAAGTVTKYSSRYQTTWEHSLYDSREVGATLAELLLPRFDQSLEINEALAEEAAKDAALDKKGPPPSPLRFRDAKKTVALLAGDLQYFHFDKPSLVSHTLDFRAQQADYGRDLVLDTLTATPNGPTGSYFRIHVDPTGHIESVTYLGNRRLPLGNILCLYGMHEKYVNNIVARFDEGIISNFASFLEEDWALPLYFDRFGEFAEGLDDELHNLREEEDPEEGAIAEVLDTLAEQLDTGAQMTDEEQRTLYKAFDCASGRKVLDAKVFEYLVECEVYRSFP
ncbi:hypothetical protein HDU86_007957 [Geranomyces michiganensis]|nr:hypothetical protein HDU86_007957 [Geranomyces michiganensis]